MRTYSGYYYSDDGRWVWDGRQWVPTTTPQPAPLPAPAPIHLRSESMVVQAPFSLTGSAKRIWNLLPQNPWWRLGLATPALALIAVAWTFIIGWYCFFGLLLVPFWIFRRGGRRRKLEQQRHRELMAAMYGRR